MNKRQKKKKEKRIAWDADIIKKDKRQERHGYNIEGYPDPTMTEAIDNATKEGY